MIDIIKNSIKTDWKKILLDNKNLYPTYKKLDSILLENYVPKDIFRALNYCDSKDIRIIILGQDPYPKGANGLAFDSNTKQGSLRNIYKEVGREFSLEDWAKQGILLLNCVLTNVEGCYGKHKKRGWEEVTKYIIQIVDKKENTFVLLGKDAQKMKYIIKNANILEAGHPSPNNTSKTFIGSGIFKKLQDLYTDMKII